jgi:hypothetical protein
MGPDRCSGGLIFSTKRGELDAARTVPAFAFSPFTYLRELPVPMQAFGLYDYFANGEKLKQYAAMKTLTSLNVLLSPNE